jgi:predicted ATPase/class 3 adenylate cyclase
MGLPQGTVTFLFTDIEGSTRLLAHLGEEVYSELLAQHDDVIRTALHVTRGVEVSTEGDSFFIAFAQAEDAVAAALMAQQQLSGSAWPGEVSVRVRMGLHTGHATLVGSTYVGMAVHQAARVSAAAHGGQVLATEATRASCTRLPAGVSWLELGRHRLKDLAGPLELHQLDHPTLDPAFPPIRSLDRVTHNLPIQPSSFLGRAAELQLGSQLLADHRVVTVTGAGGTGKTRLSYQLAADNAAFFPDGVWVAELSTVSDPSDVPGAVLAALGLQEESSATAVEQLIERLRTGRAVLMLDNCEHVVDAVATLVARLTRDCSRLTIWSTSREPLRVPGEHVWPLAPMTLPAEHERDVDELAVNDAVALFCSRAADTTHGFTLTRSNAADVLRICRRLDGIPLALELAAARTRSLTPGQLANRLSESLDLLTKGWRGAEQRQASLYGAVRWSYDLLTAAEQTVFRRLAVTVGSFDLDLAEALYPEGDAFDLMDSLVDKSFVLAADGRFRLLETMRTFAENELARSDEADLAMQLHQEWAVSWLTVGPERAVEQIDLQHANLLAVLPALPRTDAVTHGRFLLRLSTYWHLRGHWRLSRRELLPYLERPDRDRELEGLLAGALGFLELGLGELESGKEHYLVAVAVARELGDPGVEAGCLSGLGSVEGALGQFTEAIDHFELGLSLARAVGDEDLAMRLTVNLGGVLGAKGDKQGAHESFTRALALAQRMGDRHAEGICAGNLGIACYELGRYDEAQAHQQRALDLARRVGDRSSEGQWLGTLAQVATALGDHDAARAFAEQALDIARDLGDRMMEAHWIAAHGDIAARTENWPMAIARYTEALELAREIGHPNVQVTWMGSLVEVTLAGGDRARAAEYAAAALSLSLGLDIKNDLMLRQCLSVTDLHDADESDWRVTAERALSSLTGG